MFSEKAIESYRELAKQPDLLAKMAKELSPIIHGHEREKIGIMLSLVSKDDWGITRNRIHTLLIGKPGTGKSKLARWFSLFFNYPWLTHRTTDAGLTGTIHLQGPLTTAPVVFIDEFDKIPKLQRNGVLEAMSDGVVTITTNGKMVENKAQVRIIATCNSTAGFTPEQLDRFDQRFNFDLPDRKRMKGIYKHKLKYICNDIQTPDNLWVQGFIKYVAKFEPTIPDIEQISAQIENFIETEVECPTPRQVDNVLRTALAIASLRQTDMTEVHVVEALDYILS